jgi:glycosyltransferase involved in cell wall biosynthesis
VKYPDTSPRSSAIEISVVVPVRDEENSVRALLDGLLGQTLPPNEIVVTDGGSIDATTTIVEEFIKKDAPVTLIREKNSLPGRARNVAVKHSRCDWIAFIDAGSKPAPGWLASLAEKIGDGSVVDAVYGTYEPVVDSFFKECAAIAYVSPVASTLEGPARPCSIASALMQRRVWEAVAGFPENLRSAEDLLFMRKVEKANFHIVRAPAAVVYWNIQPNLWRTFKRFMEYARNNIRAGLWRDWQAAILLRYALIAMSIVPVFFVGSWWLFVPFMFCLWLMIARAIKALRRNRHSYPATHARNLVRLCLLVPIIAVIDAAAIIGSIKWLLRDKLRLSGARGKDELRG